MLIMPFAVPLLLVIGWWKWLWRRCGRKAGNAIGKAAIIIIGGPPILLACLTALLLRLVFKVLHSSN